MEAVSTSTYVMSDLDEKIEERRPDTFPELKSDVSSQIAEIQNQSRVQPESVPWPAHSSVPNSRTGVCKRVKQRQCQTETGETETETGETDCWSLKRFHKLHSKEKVLSLTSCRENREQIMTL